jgi:hypothetical protein
MYHYPPRLLILSPLQCNDSLHAVLKVLRRRLGDVQAAVKPRACAALGLLAPLLPDVDAKKTVARSIGEL